MAAVLVLLCLQESCCYDAILSMRALRPRFHATFGFFLNRRIVSCFHIFVSVWTTQEKNFLFVSLNLDTCTVLEISTREKLANI